MGATAAFFVFAIFPLVMSALLAVLGRIQRQLPLGADGALTATRTPAADLTPTRS